MVQLLSAHIVGPIMCVNLTLALVLANMKNTKGIVMNYNLFHNTSCLGDAYSCQASFK